MRPPPVHLVTDRRIARDLPAAVRAALAGLPPRAAALHLREKELGGRDLLALARALRAVCAEEGQLFLVNDRVDVAVACGADGAHLPSAGLPPAEARRLLGPDRLVGVSCHGADDVRRARDGGADYATFGPVFETPSKRAYGPPPGLPALRDAAALGLPLVALGGVDAASAPAAIAAGARGVAAIRAWLDATDPGAAVRALLDAAGATGAAPAGEARPHLGRGHGCHHSHGNPDDLDAYIAKMEARDREAWQRPDEVLRALALRPGATVADVGAGPGYFTLRVARAVGGSGRVYAVDVVPEMVAALRERLDRAGVGNVTAVLARDDDPCLPPASCDLALVVDTFHHFPDGPGYLRLLATRLRPGGRIVNIDFHRRELPVGPPLEHKVAREDFLAAAREARLELVEEKDLLPYQYFLILAPR
jgi:thiamine-phosphate pyrophosphorylase